MTKAEDESRVYRLVVVVGDRYPQMSSLCARLRLKLLKDFSKMVMNCIDAIQEGML